MARTLARTWTHRRSAALLPLIGLAGGAAAVGAWAVGTGAARGAIQEAEGGAWLFDVETLWWEEFEIPSSAPGLFFEEVELGVEPLAEYRIWLTRGTGAAEPDSVTLWWNGVPYPDRDIWGTLTRTSTSRPTPS